MTYSVGIDMGGTFTDGYFSDGGRAVMAKTATTHFDLTRSVMACLARGAERFDVALDDFLADVGLFRLATTIGTNSVVTGTGDPVGLMVEAGAEKSLYGPSEPAPAIGVFVGADHVVGTAASAPAEAVLGLCRDLVGRGVRQVVVSLGRQRRGDERRLRELVRDRYPAHYLRSIPLTLGSETADVEDDELRTATAVLNAYLSRPMAKLLYRTEGLLQQAGLPVPLLAVRSDGTCSRTARTTAISTYSSGPAAGLGLVAAEARRHGDPVAVGFDMGGTTLDLGLVRNGVYEVDPNPEIRGVRVRLPVPGVVSVGLGGSSIAADAERDGDGAADAERDGDGAADAERDGDGAADAERDGDGAAARAERDGDGAGARAEEPSSIAVSGSAAAAAAVTVGPASAGAVPGPAAFGRGGAEPTLTDADIVLGLLADGQALSDDIVLHADRAAAALAPLAGGDPVEAALRVRDAAHEKAAAAVTDLLAGAEIDPAEATLYAFGGAGGLHAGPVAERAGIRRVRSFAHGGIFSARGVACAAVEQRYEAAVEPGEDGAEVVRRLLGRARLDLQSERLLSDAAAVVVHLHGADGQCRSIAAGLAPEAADAAAVSVALQAAAPDAASGTAVPNAAVGVSPDAAVSHNRIARVEAAVVVDAPPALATELDRPAARNRRDVRWTGLPEPTAVVGLSDLPDADALEGPTLIVALGAVHAVPPGWTVRRQGPDDLLWERSP